MKNLGFCFSGIEPANKNDEFIIRWIDQNKKMVFYQEVLTEEEFMLYDLLRRCKMVKKIEPFFDEVLENMYHVGSQYFEEMMMVMEYFDPEEYKKYRLLHLTGMLEEEMSFEFSQKLLQMRNKLSQTIQSKVNTILKERYFEEKEP